MEEVDLTLPFKFILFEISLSFCRVKYIKYSEQEYIKVSWNPPNDQGENPESKQFHVTKWYSELPESLSITCVSQKQQFFYLKITLRKPYPPSIERMQVSKHSETLNHTP